ncbi:carbohydrate-binding protein [Haloarchaeobius iranensis]|uniref:Chitodextrinase n=1 Tax=Haloarchaeobius iranensis TaxID=996166 RepID=A0A1G9UWE6_9EURY|nr:carbohydrate-binding protein [Haloarchaeobius iranensis]SDM64186.1 Chitodextrinase [Haloarchaeobius iranensis]
MRRRTYLRSVSSLLGASAAASAASAASDTPPEWDADTVYTGGDRVVYEGYVWEAEWWTKGDEPTIAANVWTRIEPVDGGSGGDGPPAWSPDATYTEGDRVTHDESVWEAKWWTRGDEPGASEWGPWKLVEDGGGGGGEELAAAIDASATTVTVGESVTLDGSGSTGDVASYQWAVGDREPVTGVETAVTFDDPGEYAVTLTVTGADGATASAETTLTVEPEDQPPDELTPETTIAEFLPNYQERHIPDVFLDFMPDEVDSGGGHGGHATAAVAWPDDEKAADFAVDLDAIRNNVEDGSLQFGSLGTQALDWASEFRAAGLPDHAVAQLLPRLMLLPDEREAPTFQGPGRDAAWDETAGPVAASNDPSALVQDPWPTDARGEDDEEVAERDRVYFQAQDDPAWSDDFEYLDNYDSALLETLQENTHPATGEPLGGDSFTANAPMEVSTEVHGSDWFWYQVLLFENTGPVPYHLDGAVVWWLGPANFGKTMSAGAYNNEQRPKPGYGHPQRDIVEITLPDEHVPDEYADVDSTLSAYAVRLAYHDSPYNMRTAYPGQYWSLEISVGEPLHQKFDTAEQRQQVVDMIADTAHVELETDMDLNDDVVDAIELYNRVGN